MENQLPVFFRRKHAQQLCIPEKGERVIRVKIQETALMACDGWRIAEERLRVGEVIFYG